MTLNSILHKLALPLGEHDPIHQEIDDTVKPEKDEENGEEEATNAQV